MLTELSKSVEDITGSEVADPTDLPKVGGPSMIVRPIRVKDTVMTKSGAQIFLPETAREDIQYLCNVGRILALGPYCYKSEDLKHGTWFEGGDPKIGDYVVYGRFAGQNFRWKGVNLKYIKDTDIKMLVGDPSSLDTFANIEKS